jgi:hypothetical protein
MDQTDSMTKLNTCKVRLIACPTKPNTYARAKLTNTRVVTKLNNCVALTTVLG